MTSLFETGVSRFSPDMTDTSQRYGSSRSRSRSTSSDRPSTAAQSVMSPPISVSPEAAFIAPSAASQIVTNDHDSHADTWYDQYGFQPSGETILVSTAALRHLNDFLDHLLFNFVALSGSTTLSSLRPAVTEVLKPKLAKDAINNADEELREYLGGGDDDELLQSPICAASPRDWDLELVWKRTRLRCMVYSSLGDMEEEDEDDHIEEGLLTDDDESPGGSVSPAVAIFLTSILEFLGEQALISAGQAAWNRTRVRYEKEAKDSIKGRPDFVDRIVVEEGDMERVALDRTLGRLWRAWKKRIRSPRSVDSSLRPSSREKLLQLRQSRHSTESAVSPAVQGMVTQSGSTSQDDVTRPSEAVLTDLDDDEQAAAIPLPMSKRDVDEIEVPGLVHYSDDETGDDEPEELDWDTRPKSMMMLPLADKAEPPTPTTSQPHTPTRETRKRSNSLPTPAASPYGSPEKRKKTGATEEEAIEKLESTIQPTSKVGTFNEEAKDKALTFETDPGAVSDSVYSDSEVESVKKDAANEKSRSVGLIPKIAGAGVGPASVATVGAATAIATSRKTAHMKKAADDSDLEEIEEAQILTSSRVSVGGSVSGRSTSPANSDRSNRPPLSIHTVPVRSGSLRLVDVTSPRTPSTRSQRSSAQDQTGSSYSRSGGELSRTSSFNTQSNLEEPRAAEDNRATRASGTSSLGKPRGNVTPSISEAEENAEPVMRSTVLPAAPAAAVASRRQAATGPKVAGPQTLISDDHIQNLKPQSHWPQPTFGSVKRRTAHSPRRSPTGEVDHSQQQRPPQTKVTAISTPSDSGTFMEDDLGPLPQKHPRHSPRQFGPQSASVTSPAVQEKSISRQQGLAQNGPSQPSTIGILSVDRSALRKDSGEASHPSQDQPSTRSHHTPGSSSTPSIKIRSARASQDSTAARPGDVTKNFEELIQSNETIQYTLTPENMREIEGSPRNLSGSPAKGRKSEDARQMGRDRAGSATVNKPAEISRSASVSRSSPLHSHPVEMDMADGSSTRGPPVSMANRSRGIVPQARDARVPGESLVEFAEFIRATGPPGGAEATSVPHKRNPSLMRNASGPPPAPSSKMSADYGRPSMGGSISRARLQAREATADASSENSDLIDFIRRGPPSPGNPRIPRTVAPFRTTMDSDQLTSALGGRAMDATLPDIHDTRNSQASTNATEVSAPSVQSSISSQSGLLGRKQAAGQNSNQFDDQDTMPQRKQRRVRDPYAIDFSDEEDDDDLDVGLDLDPEPKRGTQPKEESLIDFLNSAPPPPQSNPAPFNLPRMNTMPAQPMRGPKRKASAPSLMSRFRQNSTAGSSNRMKDPKSPKSPTRQAWESRSLSSRAGAASTTSSRGYIPIQVNIPTGGDLYPTYGSTSAVPPVPAIPSDLVSSRPSGRVPMKKFEPRDAVSVPSRGTADLADFFRSSEPPPTTMSPAPYAEPANVSGGSKFFGRRKKSSAFA